MLLLLNLVAAHIYRFEFTKKKLQEDPMYLDWKESEKKYAARKTIDIVKKKLDEADFLVAFTQGKCQRHFEGRQIIQVERFGVALSVVKDRRYLKNRNN